MVLLTQMATFCLEIRPPCGANEPPPAEAFSCLDTDFIPDIRRFQQLGIFFSSPPGGPIAAKSPILLFNWTALKQKIQGGPN